MAGSGESWNFTQQGGGAGGGEVSPGSGSTGFSSQGVVYGDSVGRLTASTVVTWDSTEHVFTINSTKTGVSTAGQASLVIGSTLVPRLQLAGGAIQCRSSGAGVVQGLQIQPQGGNLLFGTSNFSQQLVIRSTVQLSTAIGGAGAAAALPLTPEVYLRVQVPNAAHTLTTLYIPCYLST